MADYRENEVTGVSWQRCHTLSFSREHNASPVVVACEQVITRLADRDIVENAGQIIVSISLDQLGTVVEMVNRETLEVVEGSTFTYDELDERLFSFYIHIAKRRDEALKRQCQ